VESVYVGEPTVEMIGEGTLMSMIANFLTAVVLYIDISHPNANDASATQPCLVAHLTTSCWKTQV